MNDTSEQQGLRVGENLHQNAEAAQAGAAPDAADAGDMAPLASVGLDLRTARVARGLKLDEISRALKIRADHLAALEEGRTEVLPGRTYAVGFVRTYASYLGLDASACVKRFKDEIAGRHDMAPPPAPSIEVVEGKRGSVGLWGIAILVVALVIYGGLQLLGVAHKIRQSSAVSEPPALTTTTPAPAGSAGSAGTAPVKVAPVKPAPAKAAPAKPAPVKPVAVSSPAAPATSPAGAADASGVNASRTPQELGMSNKAYSRVMLTVLKPAYVSVTGEDGRLFLGRNLLPGDTYHVPNIPGVVLSIADSSALGVTLNGKNMGPLGGNGVSVTGLPLDSTSLSAHFSH